MLTAIIVWVIAAVTLDGLILTHLGLGWRLVIVLPAVSVGMGIPVAAIAYAAPEFAGWVRGGVMWMRRRARSP